MTSIETRLFADEQTKIYWGEAVSVLSKNIPDGSADLIFLDPPYNIGKQFGTFTDSWASDVDYFVWCQSWIDLCVRKLTPRGSMYLMASTQAMPFLDLHVRSRLEVLARIVWHYDSSGVQAKKRFGSLYEPILHCVKDPKRYTFNESLIQIPARTGAVRKLIDYRKQVPTQYKETKLPGNVWYFPRVRYRMDEYEEHPSQKPEALMERIILASSNPGDTVLDPFAGTFTTCAVAKRLQRRSVGIEMQRDYIKTGLRRLGISDELDGESLVPPKKTFEKRTTSANNSGQIFLKG